MPLKDLEKRAAYKKAWRQRTIEHRRAVHREWRKKNFLMEREQKDAWRLKNMPRYVAYCFKWRSKDPAHSRAVTLCAGARKRAADMQVEYDLDVVEIESRIRTGKCEASGLHFDFEWGNGRKPFTPSLDRIDNTFGYVRSNVRVVVNIYNLAKNCFTDADLIKLCEAVAAKQKVL